ncbi:MAG: H-type lectin domain-containing protein [Roseicyclus sp.]|uniref:H-type lectin domain-containing protein n=1 Tax=Roseicyclus sp. TaxID=1914329 RepID=UPI003A8761BA
MKRLTHHQIGTDQGSVLMFSDFADNGPMWTGDGPREKRVAVSFAGAFRAPPMVHVGISMWDTDGQTNQRADLRAEEVTEMGFDLVFRTWGDSRIARIRADWIAFGTVLGEDDWDVD